MPAPTEVGRSVEGAVETVNGIVAQLISMTQQATGAKNIAATGLHLKVMGDPGCPRLLFRPDGGEGAPAISTTTGWRELFDDDAGIIATPTQSGVSTPLVPSPLTARERQVAVLMRQGLGDRPIANDLCLSPKTVEKHVSAVLRKTGTTSRTAAVLRCLENGWM